MHPHSNVDLAHHRKRRLTSPLSPKSLMPLSNNSVRSTSPAPSRIRVKDQREAVRARAAERELNEQRERRRIEQIERFRARWGPLRTLYASVSNLAGSQRRKPSSSSGRLSPIDTASSPSASLPPMATVWVHDLAIECRRAFVDPLATFSQLEVAFWKVLRRNSTLLVSIDRTDDKATLNELQLQLRAVFRAFAGRFPLMFEETKEKVDYRDILNALTVLEKWRDGERRLLMLWFDEFSTFTDRSTLAIRTTDAYQVLSAAGEGAQDELVIQAIVNDLLVAIDARAGAKHGFDMGRRAGMRITEAYFASFIDSHPTLLEHIKAQCWKRLTDDTRLEFYRDLYASAESRFHKEGARVRSDHALALWRSREPRARWRRWVQFVADQKLLKRGEKRFYACSGAKMLRQMRTNARRRSELRAWTQKARVYRELALQRRVFTPWHNFYSSTLLIHAAAARRSERLRRQSLLARAYRVLSAFYQDAKSRHAEQRSRVDVFVARRERKVMQTYWREWDGFYRRRKEVAAADKRQRALLGSLSDLGQQHDELAKMEIEDTISAAVEVRARRIADEERQRLLPLQAAMAVASRRRRLQEEARTQFKREREKALQDAAAQAWAHIADQVATQVRSSTLEWLSDTREGAAAVHDEATRIFEQDPKDLLQHLLAREDPSIFMQVPTRCHWQLRLEDGYGGDLRLSKPYFLNVESYKKFFCEELVMEDCAEIAREVLVARRIDEALERVREKQAQQQLDNLRASSAAKIQAMARIRRARKTARSLIRARFVRRIEPHTGDVVFFDIYSRTARRKPPLLAGNDVDACISAESSTWVRRIDDDGDNYYITIDSSASEPLLLRGPPDHFAMCGRCRFSFASRRHTPTGERACVACYAEQRHRRIQQRRAGGAASFDDGQGEDSDWSKVAVQPVGCVVCRNALATVICRACRGDAACARCHQAVHAKLKKCTHDASFEPLVSRVG